MARLPGPRTAWIILWAILPLSHPAVLTLVVRRVGHDAGWDFFMYGFGRQLIVAYIVALGLWATGKFVRDLRAVEPALARLTGGDEHASADSPIQGLYSIIGPIVLTAVLTLIFAFDLAIGWGLPVALIMLPMSIVVNLPIMTVFWVYVMLLVGLDRLGRRKLRLEPFPQDPSLGLRPVGSLAANGFWVFCAGTVPFLFVAVRSRLDLVVGLTIFLAGVFIFFLSMARLHRQMVAAKQQHLDWARHLYVEAFGPVRPAGTLDALRAQAPLLSAAEALEKRALAIQEWPFDERTNSRIAAVVTGVTIGAISRLVLRSLGI